MPPPESWLGRLDAEDPANAELVRRLRLHHHGEEQLDAAGLDLTGKLLGGIDLSRARLTRCRFDRAGLQGADFYGAYLNNCSFNEADLTAASFAKSEADDCHLRKAVLHEVTFLRWEPSRADFREADLAGADLRRFTCVDCDMRDAILSDAHFDRTCLDRCLLAGASLIGASGTLLPYPINVGSPEAPHLLVGDDALHWLRAAGATDVSWFVPEPR